MLAAHPRPRVVKLAIKRNGILSEIFRCRQCLRFDLARRLNINASMVGQYVNDLLEEKLLVEGDPADAPRGRAPLKLNPDYGSFLGLDIEALRARCTLCDFSGQVLHRRETLFEHPVSRDRVLEQAGRLARQVAALAPSKLLQVGIAAPGQVDCAAGKVHHYRLIPGFDDVPITEHFSKLFDAPVFVEDNIRALAYAELLRGAGYGARDFLCLAVRSGIGLGVVIDGRLYRGAGSLAGEAGYTLIPTPEGPRLATDVLSATGFVQLVRQRLADRRRSTVQSQLHAKGDTLIPPDIVAAAEQGDAWLTRQLEELGEQLGVLSANLVNLFAPERLILTGEVPVCAEIVRKRLEATLHRLVLPQIHCRLEVVDGQLGGFAGALGAAWLGFSRAFSTDEEELMSQVATAG